ncbi:CBS domain-containing protein, partial [Sphingomonas adhaesiva]
MADDRSSAGNGDHHDNGLLAGLRNLIFGEQHEETLRDRLEEVIDRHEGDPAPDAKGDLTPLERQMVRNLLHFGERDAGDVGVPRADVIAVEEATTFDHLVQVFAEAGVSRLPVYRESLDHIIGMVHIKDVFAIMAAGGTRPASIAALIR